MAARAVDTAHRLNLGRCPDGVREVILSPTETLRLRVNGDHVEGSFYRLRRKGEQGDAVLRFANRRLGLDELLRTLLGEGDSASTPETVCWYVRATAWGARLP